MLIAIYFQLAHIFFVYMLNQIKKKNKAYQARESMGECLQLFILMTLGFALLPLLSIAFQSRFIMDLQSSPGFFEHCRVISECLQ
jgi:hypothetical protein